MNYRVDKISRQIAQKIISHKHYSKRLGIFWEGFGLFDGNKIIGVCCFGQPSPAIQKHAFFNRDFSLYELTRLVVDRGASANAASFLISQSLKLLNKKPCAIVSYADSAHGHCGIVYQATNWIYTGGTKSHDKLYMVNGEALHPTTVRDRFKVTSTAAWAKENKILTVSPSIKHRYFYFCGSKKEIKNMKSKLRYQQINSYPKTAQMHYNDGLNCSEYL